VAYGLGNETVPVTLKALHKVRGNSLANS